MLPFGFAVLLLSALAVVGLVAAAFVVVPLATSVIDCTKRADEVAADVRAAVEASVGASPTGSSVEACEGGHHVSVGLDFTVPHDDLSAALTRAGCRPSASSASDEFGCRWVQDGHNIDVVLIRRGVTSVVASVDL